MKRDSAFLVVKQPYPALISDHLNIFLIVQCINVRLMWIYAESRSVLTDVSSVNPSPEQQRALMKG